MRSSVAAAPSPLQDIVTLDEQAGAFWIGAWGNVNLVVWHDVVTMDAVQRLDRTNPARTAAHPEKISSVYIATLRAKPPEAQVRDAINTMFDAWGHTVGCGAVVIESAGFGGVVLRSVVAGMLLIAPKHYRVKVFDSVERAAPWVAENHVRSTGVNVSEADMLIVLKHARSRGL